MCDSRNSAIVTLKNGRTIRVDACLQEKIQKLQDNDLLSLKETLSCCCGHGKYPETIVCSMKNVLTKVEIISMSEVPRKKRFYRKDEEGYYYIPEVEKR